MSLIRPVLRPVLRSPLRSVFDVGVGGGGASPILLAPPEGFDWTPPINVFRSASGIYTTDFNADDWKFSAENSIYVSKTGNDATGTGSAGSPFASIKKAIETAAAGADTGYNIFVGSGEYLQQTHFSGTSADRDINFIATGGRVTCTNKIAIATWTADGAGTYKATRSSAQDVRDWRYPVTWPNGERTPQLLTNVSSVAECQATPGSWYLTGGEIWVHLTDGRLPDAAAGGDVGVIIGTTSGTQTNGRSWFVQGFDFEGSSAACFRVRPPTTVASPQFVMDDCTARFQRLAAGRAIELDGVSVAILHRVRTFETEGDGIGYSRRDASSPSTYAVEIDCAAFNCGRPATQTGVQNGSTNHAVGRVVRVNSLYLGTYGPVVADVGGSQSWCLGVDAQDCLLGSGTSQDSCFQSGNPSGDTVKMWLDGCVIGGAHFDLYSGAGCQILYRNMAPPASVGGAGVVGTY